MAEEGPRALARVGKARAAWLIVLAVAMAVALGWNRLAAAMEEAHKIGCKGSLKGLGLSLLMYAGDCDEHFPPDLSLLVPGGYLSLDALNAHRCYSATRSTPATLGEMRESGHPHFQYFGRGLQPEPSGKAKTIILCDRPGNHSAYFNVILADGGVYGYHGESVEQIADENGFFVSGYNIPGKADTGEEAKPE